MKSTRNSGLNELICKLYESGKTIRNVSEIVGLSTTTVRYHLKKGNVAMRPAHRIASGNPGYIPHPRKLKVDAEELRKLVAKGTRVVDMAAHFNCAPDTVSRALKKYGWSIRNVTNEEVKQMLDLREQGLTSAEIAKRIGRCYDTVLNHIGYQPSEITENSLAYRTELCKLKNKRRISGKAIMVQKRVEEARIEAERKAAEEAARREEEARAACETSIREILASCGLPSEIHIESSAQGNAILANMQNRFSAAIAAA